MSIDKIKEELQSINSRNTAFNYIIQDPTIEKLTKALSVSIDFLDSFRTNTDGDICYNNLGEAANDAFYAAKQIAEILSGGGEKLK